MEIACKALRRHNRHIAAAFQHCYVRNPRHCLNAEYKARFFSHAKTSFTFQYQALQDAFLHFFRCTSFLILADPAVHTLLEDIPRFGQLVLRDIWIGKNEGICQRSLPTACDTCGKIVSRRRNRFIRHTSNCNYVEEGDQISETFGFCGKCYSEESGSEDEEDAGGESSESDSEVDW